MTLQELFAFTRKQVFRMFHDTGEISPMWHAIAGDGEHLIIATPWCNDDEKDDAIRALRHMFKHRGVTQFAFVCEAWAVRLNGPLKDGEVPRASEHQDRREVLRVSAEDDKGNMLSGQFYVLRPEHGKVTLSKFEQDDYKAGTVAGRMTGLLKSN